MATIDVPANRSILLVNVSSAAKTFRLPAISSFPGRMIIFKDIFGAAQNSSIFLSTTGADIIERSTATTTRLSTSYGAWTFLNDGNRTWFLADMYANTMFISVNAGFSPISISGIQLWMDGADPAGTGIVPSNGSVLSSWIDKSGNSKNAVGVNSPTVVTNAVNSKSAVSYNGSSYSYSSITAGTFSTAMNIFFVYKVNGSVTYMAPMTRGQGNNGSPIDQYNATRFLGGGSYNSYTSAWSHASATSTTLFTQIIQQSPSTSMNEYVNGSTSASLSITGFSASDSATLVYIATRDDKVTSFNGYMCELIVYNQMVGLTAQQRIEGYLAWKWGLQANLPVGHPFKSAAP